MSDTDRNEDDRSRDGDGGDEENSMIEFIQYHQPALESGEYNISVEQTVKIDPGKPASSDAKFHAEKTFLVHGERFRLKPGDIHAVFPPEGNLGQHCNCLPHIVLKRSTLPWERESVPENKELPWLVLLLFEEQEILDRPLGKKEFIEKFQAIRSAETESNEKSEDGELVWNHLLDVGWLESKGDNRKNAIVLPKEERESKKLEGDFAECQSQIEATLDQLRQQLQVLTVDELAEKCDYVVKWPGIEKEEAQHGNDKVTVIDVRKKLLESIIPSKDDLAYLAHVRQATDDEGNQTEVAVVIGNRLPAQSGISIAHLVSVEGRYDDNGFINPGAKDDEFIRLVSLKSWRFECVSKKHTFRELLSNLDTGTDGHGTLRLPGENKEDSVEEEVKKKAEEYLAMGYVPVPHYMRQGDKTVSWYHGPLAPGHSHYPSINLPVRAADELVRYDTENGIFDVSYAAAWELGRLLALQNKRFSTSLYRWKRAHTQLGNVEKQLLIHLHLPIHSQPSLASGSADMPDELLGWFEGIKCFHDVPFNYLVPDERMLPSESIRFFQVDNFWTECLVDGAFSIGRVTKSDHKRDEERRPFLAANGGTNGIMSGFLLRSDVVAGWPDLLVDAYSEVLDNDKPDDAKPLKMLRMDRLSANVLICLFEGEVKTVDIHQKPESLHYGLGWNENLENPEFYKKLRNEDGEQTDDKVTIPWDESTRTIDISELAKGIAAKQGGNDFNPAQFAFQMIEGAERVRFVIDGES